MVIFKKRTIAQIGFALGVTLASLQAQAFESQRLTNIGESTTQSTKVVAKLNVNEATLEQLMAIKGLGEVKAQAILDYIEKHGKLVSLDELTEVRGIGKKLVSKVSHQLTI
ncbi:MAG: helix-hairpin-helix domain-containing protein [Gammaproteobacteria bacterium]|nr:helix-hairpin-helix domain-containing protein [Gammaproteobacteria bacterium]